MDALTVLMPLLRKYLSDEEVQAFKLAGENRLRDVKAFIYGGDLTDGTHVPGQRDLYQAIIRQARETQALREEVAKLLAAKAPGEVADLATPPSDGGGQSGT